MDKYTNELTDEKLYERNNSHTNHKFAIGLLHFVSKHNICDTSHKKHVLVGFVSRYFPPKSKIRTPFFRQYCIMLGWIKEIAEWATTYEDNSNKLPAIAAKLPFLMYVFFYTFPPSTHFFLVSRRRRKSGIKNKAYFTRAHGIIMRAYYVSAFVYNRVRVVYGLCRRHNNKK